MGLAGWISPMMGLGMILVAACPGGNISNFMSSLGKANIELSVSLTAISTALAILMTPFNFWLWGNLFLDNAAIAAEVPKLVIPLWDVFKTIFILLGIPLTLGILTSQYLPKVANALKKPLQWISIVFFIAMVILSFSSNMQAFLQCVKYIFIVVLIHNLLALGIGFSVGTIAKVPFREFRPWPGPHAWHFPLRRFPAARRHAGHHRMVGHLAHHSRPYGSNNLQPEQKEQWLRSGNATAGTLS